MNTRTDPTWAHPISDFLGPSPDFSLVLGGPLFQLMRGSHLADDALGLVRQRILFFSLFTWLPLLVLSAIDGHLFAGSAAVPFVYDIDLHIRFLVALPLLVIAELVVHQRTRPVVHQFLERNMVREDEMPRFVAAIKSAVRLRNSLAAEVLLIAFVYAVGVLVVWRHFLALETGTWYATPSVNGAKLSLAGMWYGFVSLPGQIATLIVPADVAWAEAAPSAPALPRPHWHRSATLPLIGLLSRLRQAGEPRS